MQDNVHENPNLFRRLYRSCQLTEGDRRNSRRATWWLAAWAVAFIATTWLTRREILGPGWASYVAIAVCTLLGGVAMLAYVRFIREADELHRKIQLEALGLGFAGGFLGTFTFSLLENLGHQPDLGDPFMVMVVFYVVGVLLGTRRYA